MYYIVVNRHRVQHNRKHGTSDPIFRISKGKYGKPFYACLIDFKSCKLIEDTLNPLPCGATVWIEAEDITYDA